MSVTLLAPQWLWLLLAVPLVALVRSRVRIRAHAAIRMVVLALLVLALARPALWTTDEREHAVFVVDASASAAPASLRGTLEALATARQALPASVLTTLITIGDVPAELAASFERSERLQRPASPPSTPTSAPTPTSALSLALARAALTIPDGARGSVTVVSDGRATDRRWGDALLALQERGIPVHTVQLPLAESAPGIASLTAVRPPRIGHSVELEIEVVGGATTGDATVPVELQGPQGPIGNAEVAMHDGYGRTRLSWEPPAAGFLALQARTGACTLTQTFAVQDALQGLYLGQRIAEAAPQLQRLLGSGTNLTPWQGTEGASLPDLGGFDFVFLDDLPADQLGTANLQRLVEQIQQRGLGLIASGGQAAFGPGGYAKTELERVFPVESVQKEEKRDPSTTLVLIIDTSGSMVGERIQLAKEVARLAMARLLPHDKVGIVEFYGAKRWAAPIQAASNMIDLSRAINRMDAGGGTVIMPAIEEAYYGLQNVQTRYKHVLVLTDGGVETGAFEPLLRRMAREGVNLSTVLVGAESHSEFLVDLANWGKGRFYAVADRFNLPEVMFKQPTNSRLPAYKPGRFPVQARGGPGWWGGVERADIPALAGYVETMARPGAEVLLEVAGERDPVLATWRHGLGRVTAFTSEPVGPGTEPWRQWRGYAPLLARVVTRTADDGRARFAFTAERRGAELEVLAERRRPGDELPTANRVDAAGKDLGALAWDQRAPGVFLARQLLAPDEEVRLVCGAAGLADEPRQRLCVNARADELGELAVPPAAALPLRTLSATTAGDVVATAQLAGFHPRAGGPSAPERLRELAPWLLLLGLATWLFELLHRRRDVRI